MPCSGKTGCGRRAPPGRWLEITVAIRQPVRRRSAATARGRPSRAGAARRSAPLTDAHGHHATDGRMRRTDAFGMVNSARRLEGLKPPPNAPLEGRLTTWILVPSPLVPEDNVATAPKGKRRMQTRCSVGNLFHERKLGNPALRCYCGEFGPVAANSLCPRIRSASSSSHLSGRCSARLYRSAGSVRMSNRSRMSRPGSQRSMLR